jgi:hypothetical protein
VKELASDVNAANNDPAVLGSLMGALFFSMIAVIDGGEHQKVW